MINYNMYLRTMCSKRLYLQCKNFMYNIYIIIFLIETKNKFVTIFLFCSELQHILKI